MSVSTLGTAKRVFAAVEELLEAASELGPGHMKRGLELGSREMLAVTLRGLALAGTSADELARLVSAAGPQVTLVLRNAAPHTFESWKGP